VKHALAGVSAALLALAANAQAAPSADSPAPQLACDEPLYDFGNVSDTAPLTHSFVLWNRGTAPLRISNVRACCGGKAKAAADEVAPGTNTTVAVELSLRGRSGPQDKSVYVASNDPRQPYYRLRLSGRVVPQVEVDPGSVAWRDLSPQSVTGTVLNVSSRLMGGTPTNAVADVRWLKAELGARHGVATPVTLTTVPPLPRGVSLGKVRILFPDDAVRSLDVSVSLSVPAEVAALPPELVLAWAPDRKQAATRYLLLKSARSEPFRVLRVDCPFPGWTSEATLTGPGVWRIRLDNLSVDKPPETAMLRIATDHPACPEVAVPVRVVDP
jgi:hypothetical protein